MPSFRKICLGCSGIALLVLLAELGLRNSGLWQPAALALSVCLAIGMGAVPRLAGYQYTAWIIAAVTELRDAWEHVDATARGGKVAPADSARTG